MSAFLPLSRQTGAVCLLFLLLLGSQEIAAQGDGTSLAEYRALLVESRAVLAANTVEEAELKSLAQRWASIEYVIAPDGTRQAVGHQHLLNLLLAADPDLAAIRARLDALETVWSRWPQREFDVRSAQGALSVLENILDRPQFQWPQEGPMLLERIWDRLLRFLFNAVPDHLAGGRLLSAFLAAIGALLLLAVLLYVGRSLFAAMSPSGEESRDTAEHTEVTSDKALREAEMLARQGSYRLAVRYLYLSSLLKLDERGLIRYDPTRTNREYLRSISDRPELETILREVVDVFDRVWYGFRPLDRSTYARFEAQVRTLRELR